MERLEQAKTYLAYLSAKARERGSVYVDKQEIANARYCLQELTELVKAKEDGRLVKLPCKVGDTVYDPIYDKNFNERFVSEDRKVGKLGFMTTYQGKEAEFEYIEDVGKTVFLTRAEAEAALEGGG